jgi:hypothetical protein
MLLARPDPMDPVAAAQVEIQRDLAPMGAL